SANGVCSPYSVSVTVNHVAAFINTHVDTRSADVLRRSQTCAVRPGWVERFLGRGAAMLQPVDHVVAGVRCAVHDSDPTRREAVVFVHGNPGPMDDWEELAPAVATFARVVAMDMPGYGRAEHPRRFDYTIEGYGRYLGALLDHLSVERAHLVL